MKSTPLNRRKFLMTSAAVTAAVLSSPLGLAAAGPSAPSQRRLALNGAWEVSPDETDDWMRATVPGCVHTDLLAAGKISDPFFRDHEKDLQWIGQTAWRFRRSFDVPGEMLNRHRVRLRCAGLDTLAIVSINGQELGRTDNMFRTWEFDVKSTLRPGANQIEIAFASPLPLMKKQQSARPLFEWIGSHEPAGRAWVRKEPCNFGWDWGPVLITCGIWRDIALEAFDHVRIEELLVQQDHSVAGKVVLGIETKTEIASAIPLQAIVSVSRAGKTLQVPAVALEHGAWQATVEINDPELWWPAGMGAQPLYEVTVELRDDQGATIDRAVRRIGLRTLKLLPPDKKNSLRFTVNGIPFFAKGANWIPADPFPNRVATEKLRRYVADAAGVNMNFLRFWGGGYYEDDALFDACDEAGICVWMDFKFACSTYPVFDDGFMENVRLEARDQLRRLRHHPCIAVWCGNNEISLMTKKKWSDTSMSRADYDKLFKELLGNQVAAFAPQADYVSGSPDCGDVHFWGVWHGDKPFEAYRSLSGFMSEFGFQSFPPPLTVASFTALADRDSVLSPVMQWHQRSGAAGNQKLYATTLRYFQAPKDFVNTLWVSQMLQAYAIKLGAEHWRRSRPRAMGCLFWQYNDTWPGATWSSVDYFGRWKALQFLARRFYAPLLVSGLEIPRRGEIKIYTTSDFGEPRRGTVEWRVTNVVGDELLRGSQPMELAPRSSTQVTTLRLAREIRLHGVANLLVWLKLVVDGKTESENLVAFVRPKALQLTEPQLKTSVAPAENGFRVTLSAEKPALWCWLELDGMDARYSDNFIHLNQGGATSIHVAPATPMTPAEVTGALRVRSLFDTYLHA